MILMMDQIYSVGCVGGSSAAAGLSSQALLGQEALNVRGPLGRWGQVFWMGNQQTH